MADIKHKLEIAASPEKVFENLTTQEGLSGWWTPDTHAKPAVNSVLRFGFGPFYFKEMKVVSLVPPERVEWKCIAATEEWIGTNIQFVLEKTVDNTTLYFSHNNWEAATPLFSQCSYDWAMFLRSLKLLTEKGKGNPFPHQHQ